MKNFEISFLVYDKNKVCFFMRIVCLIVIFEKAANFEIVICCKLQVALYGLNEQFAEESKQIVPDLGLFVCTLFS